MPTTIEGPIDETYAGPATVAGAILAVLVVGALVWVGVKHARRPEPRQPSDAEKWIVAYQMGRNIGRMGA
jgi:hypothetical protein